MIGVERGVPAEEGLTPQHRAHRRQGLSQGRELRFPVGADRLQRLAEPGLAAAAEIGPVGLAEVAVDVEEEERHQRRVQHPVGPGDVEPGQRQPGLPAEQRRPIRMGGLQMGGDHRRVRDRAPVLDQHRHLVRSREGERLRLGEPPRPALEGEALVLQGEADAPAERAEAPVRIGGGEFVEHAGHECFLRRRPVRAGRLRGGSWRVTAVGATRCRFNLSLPDHRVRTSRLERFSLRKSCACPLRGRAVRRNVSRASPSSRVGYRIQPAHGPGAVSGTASAVFTSLARPFSR